MGSTTAQKIHFGSSSTFVDDGTIIFIDNDKNTVTITGMGYAIGHYARWIRKGVIRVEATSKDPLFHVASFRDDSQKRIVLVIINNRSEAATVNVNLGGVTLRGNLTGEQSTSSAAWQPLAPFAPGALSQFSLKVPPKSVMTVTSVTGD